MKYEAPYHINIKKLAKESDSPLLRRLPSFIFLLLAWIIRQKEMNRVLDKYHSQDGRFFLNEIFKDLNIKLNIKGMENLPGHSKCFFVANHPYGIADGLILTRIVINKYGDFRAIGNNLFALVPPLKQHLAAVNVFGKSQREYMVALEEIYLSDVAITHFPAGVVSRVQGGKIRDGEWQKSFITKSIACQREVVPIHIDGRNSILFYAIYIIRKVFHIRLNIELMLLPREFFNKKNKRINVTIGAPISYGQWNKMRTHKQWAQWVKNHVYETLGKK